MSFASVKIRELSAVQSQDLNMLGNFQSMHIQPDIFKPEKNMESF